VLEQTAPEWKRGEVVSNSVRTYFEFRRLKEKRLSSTVSWRVQADQPVDVMGQVEISGPGLETITLPVRFDFRARPVGLEQGKMPPPQPALNPNYYVGAMHYPGWIPGQASGWSLLDPYPERKPALGYHDESQPDVASWEIKWALENGINFYMFCWYFMKDTPPTVDDLFLGEILHEGFLKSPFMDQMKFAILWENDPSRSSASPRERILGELMPFWIEQYFKHPSYLVIEGKPFLPIYDLKNFVNQQGGVEGAKETVRLMREAAVAAGFKGLWLAAEMRYTEPGPFHLAKAIDFDATFPYCHGMGPVRNQAMVDEIMRVGREQDRISKLPVIPTASVSWGVEPWIEYIDYPWKSSEFLMEPPYFQQLIEQLKARIDARPGDNPLAKRMLLLDNWNEYAEGHWIAPSRREGFGYLNAVRAVFAPDAPPPVNVMLEDVGLEPDESAHQAWMQKMMAELPPPQ
jgi:hypothetical protein